MDFLPKDEFQAAVEAAGDLGGICERLIVEKYPEHTGEMCFREIICLSVQALLVRGAQSEHQSVMMQALGKGIGLFLGLQEPAVRAQALLILAVEITGGIAQFTEAFVRPEGATVQ